MVVKARRATLRWVPDSEYPDGTVWDLFRGDEHLGWVVKASSCMACTADLSYIDRCEGTLQDAARHLVRWVK